MTFPILVLTALLESHPASPTVQDPVPREALRPDHSLVEEVARESLTSRPTPEDAPASLALPTSSPEEALAAPPASALEWTLFSADSWRGALIGAGSLLLVAGSAATLGWASFHGSALMAGPLAFAQSPPGWILAGLVGGTLVSLPLFAGAWALGSLDSGLPRAAGQAEAPAQDASSRPPPAPLPAPEQDHGGEDVFLVRSP